MYCSKFLVLASTTWNHRRPTRTFNDVSSPSPCNEPISSVAPCDLHPYEKESGAVCIIPALYCICQEKPLHPLRCARHLAMLPDSW